jgi:hypothetical protein
MACSATAPAVLFSECLLDTGHPYLNSIGCGPPPVSKLTRLIAPAPYSSSWSDQLCSREARGMGQFQH